MTIGIAASGPNAGLAVLRALAAVEKVAEGAIRGYAVFAAVDEAGTLHRAETQRGGTTTLFVDGERTGVGAPEPIASARVAGVMSSGPDRPTPLTQFLPAEPGVGLVTGHRLPNAPSASARPINLDILERLHAGLDARAAVDAVLDVDPDADAGVIVVDGQGHLYARNSDRVARRPDLGQARRECAAAGAAVEVLLNAIFPAASVAALAADIALGVMVRSGGCDSHITVAAGLRVVAAEENRVRVDDNGRALLVETADHRILRGRWNCAAIYLGSQVVQGGQVVGWTVAEPNVLLEEGRIVSMSGQKSTRIGYRINPRR